uniref:peptidylprolyl isomerase n=1 Tax=Haptolina brevifila TaxID=156173 RepID=A0A7S2IDK5_9EUKA|mmetsp:Transcript_64905/g.128312  ORF Transcript_64905/g.128312 Transcript_64905/m.128312 type:complete len:236 (+) Transcript_64905:57-764(+)
MRIVVLLLTAASASAQSFLGSLLSTPSLDSEWVEAGRAYLARNGEDPDVTTLSSGLQYKVLTVGPPEGELPTAVSRCVCHYVGSYFNGTVFESSVERGAPTQIVPNQVVKGWSEALLLMRQGDKWALTVPSDLAYGDKGNTRIPGGSVLNFELEIIEIKGPSMFTWFGVDLSRFGFVILMVIFQIYQLCFAPTEHDKRKGGKLKLEEVAKADGHVVVFFEVQVGKDAAGRIEMSA